MGKGSGEWAVPLPRKNRGQCLIIWHSIASFTAAASSCSNEPMPTIVPAPCGLPAQITRYGLSQLLPPSCRLFTQYACTFVYYPPRHPGNWNVSCIHVIIRRPGKKNGRHRWKACGCAVVRRILSTMYFLRRPVNYSRPLYVYSNMAICLTMIKYWKYTGHRTC